MMPSSRHRPLSLAHAAPHQGSFPAARIAMDPHDLLRRLYAMSRAGAPAIRAAVWSSGAGAGAASMLFRVPGASSTIVDFSIPYSRSVLLSQIGLQEQWGEGEGEGECGGDRAGTERFVSAQVALRMAMAARQRAEIAHAADLELDTGCRDVSALAAAVHIGVGCTATIATDREKAGAHRAFVAASWAAGTSLYALQLCKGARSREQEDWAVSRCALPAPCFPGRLPRATVSTELSCTRWHPRQACCGQRRRRRRERCRLCLGVTNPIRRTPAGERSAARTRCACCTFPRLRRLLHCCQQRRRRRQRQQRR